jgi:Capsule assembly protein Wzi
VRTRILLFLAVSAIGAFPLFGQITPATPAPERPQATPAPADSVPALPPYGQDPQKPGTGTTDRPVAQPAPQPSTTQGPTTQQEPYKAYVPYAPVDAPEPVDNLGSTYIPLDSWVYPAMTRLYGLGYANTMFLGMRPWTRRSVLHMLQESENDILFDENQEAVGILDDVLKYLEAESPTGVPQRGMVYGLESAYTRFMGIGGTTLRDSFHLGQTINNDYGRPYQSGVNNITGFSTLAEYGRFSFYLRGEYQHAPGGTGYSTALSTQLSTIDGISFAPPNFPQDTIPSGPIPAQNSFRIDEADLSFYVLRNEISFGKTDAWLGPAKGSSMAWSNNAENIYSFRINRTEPLFIPYLSKLIGPMRYDFFYGSLKGHTYPNSPYTHSEMFSFRPTSNFEFGFQRTIIFGGADHAPVTLGQFLHGFFYLTDTSAEVKLSREDPGARYSDFSTSYRIPYLRKYLMFYLDSIAHDDVTPISAPRRAAFRTGLYLSQFPGLRKLSMRVEAVSTDPPTARSLGGTFNYYEAVQRQGYTNKGYIMGDWIGREAKGGQAWLTYNLSGNQWVELEYLNKKTTKDFIPGGTTQNEFKASIVKRFGPNVELNAWVQYEGWKAPIYMPGLQTNTVGAFQLTLFPQLHDRQPSH